MTSIETGPSWVERLNPRHWTLVWKLVIVGLVPALLALTLGALRIADQAGSAAELGRNGRLLNLHTQVAATSDALRIERDHATVFVAGKGLGDRTGLGDDTRRTDEALTNLRNGLTSATPDLEPSVLAALQRAEGGMSLVPALRQAVTPTPSVPYDQVVSRYTNIIGTVDVLDRAILRQLRVPATAGLADALIAVTNALEQLSAQHAVLAAAIRTGRPLPDDSAVVNAASARLVEDYSDYKAALTTDQLSQFGVLPDPSKPALMDQMRTVILDAPFQLTPLADDWNTAYDQARAPAAHTAQLLDNELAATSAAAAQHASNLAGINSVVLMLGLLIGIAIAVLVSRSLIRSLRLLRSSALDVAERRLPQAVESMRAGEAPDVAVEPVPIGTRDEVGQVARAFDAVHGQAVRLAAEQAALQANVSAMFINLSRRSQALVERQLQLIEALESNEQDADQLSNLFQLDHLATRMRRNSENLLVLAGTDLAKRNMAPVPIVDVLRAAVSEVEQYQRVVVQAPPAASIAGRAGSDLVHLLAELLDNATAFSPPESQVIMSTTRAADGAIVIEISDRGVGMADDELADANMRLAGSPGVDVSASRRMGLFVVGRLAARHGIGVRLSTAAAGPGSGLTASVSVPPSLIPIGMPAEAPRRVGVPMSAGVPAQGGPAQARPTRPEPNGAPLSALVTGPDAAGNAPPVGPDPTVAGGGQSPMFAGRPPVNGTTAHGLPTRKPGSSLRPDGPPPTEAPPGGFFDDGGRAAGRSEGARPPGEQARLDQEAAARRDRMDGAAGLAAVPPLTGHPTQDSDDERSISGDERSGSDAGPADRPRLTKDRPEPGDRPFDGSEPEGAPEGGRGAGPRPVPSAPGTPGRTGRPTDPGAVDGRGTPLGAGAAAADSGGANNPAGPGESAGRGTFARSGESAGRRTFAGPGGSAGAGPGGAAGTDSGQPGTGSSDTARPDTGTPDTGQPDTGSPEAARGPGKATGADAATGADTATGAARMDGRSGPTAGGAAAAAGAAGAAAAAAAGMAAARRDKAAAATDSKSATGRASGDVPSDDAATPTTGTDPLPRRVAGPPSPAGSGPWPGGPSETGQFRTDQQARPRGQYRSVGSVGGFPSGPPPDARSHGRAPSSAPAPDELFAPRVPSLDPDRQLPGHDPHASEFDLGETTPIFEEIASAWFRSNRPVPVSWESDTGSHPTGRRPTTAPVSDETDPNGIARPSAPTTSDGRAGTTAAGGGWSGAGTDTPPSTQPTPPSSRPPAPRAVPPTDPAGTPPAAAVPPSATPPGAPAARPPFGPADAPAARLPESTPADFSTAADEGWLAASGAVADRPEELTAAGLPKRRPRARLIPGSAGSAVLAPAVTAARSAESIRGRLASYQQGVRQGRETRLRGLGSDYPASPATPGADHDEESS